MQAGGKAPYGLRGATGLGRAGVHIDTDAPAAALEAEFQRLQNTDLFGPGDPKTVGHHVQHPAIATGALAMHAGKPTGAEPQGELLGAGGQWHFYREGDYQARITGLGGAAAHFSINGLGRVVLHGLDADLVEQMPGAGKQQLEVVVELGHRPHGGAARAHRVGLVDGNGGWHALDLVDRRFVHAVQKLAGVGREGLDITALAFGVQGVKHQAGLARAAGPGDHRQFTGADVQVQVFEIVLTRPANADGALGHSEALQSRGAAF